jgi:CheY-like chemotaxis protein
VLIIEDEEDIRLLTRVILEGAGHRVTEAATGEAALVAMRQEVPDLVLLDIRLPGIDGWEVLEAFNAEPAWLKVPVVVMSAHSSGDALARAKAMGITSYLLKPFTRDDLLAAVAG